MTHGHHRHDKQKVNYLCHVAAIFLKSECTVNESKPSFYSMLTASVIIFKKLNEKVIVLNNYHD